MHSLSCPTCHALHHLLVEVGPVVVRLGVEARTKGPGWGVLVTLPDYVSAETEEERAALQVARELGYFVGAFAVPDLIAFVRTVDRGSSGPENFDRVVQELEQEPPAGRVHVVGVLGRCVAALTVHATPAILAACEGPT